METFVKTLRVVALNLLTLNIIYKHQWIPLLTPQLLAAVEHSCLSWLFWGASLLKVRYYDHFQV